MSDAELSRKLQQLMNDSVADLVAPFPAAVVGPARQRQRGARAALAAATFLAVALVVGVTAYSRSATTQVRTSGLAASSVLTTLPPGVQLALPPENAVTWNYRGSLPLQNPSGIDGRATRAWASSHRIGEGSVLSYPLWSGRVSDRDVVLLVTSSLKDDPATTGHIALYAETSRSDGQLLLDQVSQKNVSAIVSRIRTPGGDYVLAVARPQSILTYGSPREPLVAANQRGDGWAVFPALPSDDPGRVTVAPCNTCASREIAGA